MAAVGNRPIEQIFYFVCETTLLTAGGALLGYAYAAAANLPARQCAKAWVVWIVAESVILSLGSLLTDKHSTLMFIKAALFTFTSIIGIDEMRKRGLMGDRMLTVILVIRSLIILGLLTNAAITARRQTASSSSFP